MNVSYEPTRIRSLDHHDQRDLTEQSSIPHFLGLPLQNLEIASNNPPSCDAYGQPLPAQPPAPPQPTASPHSRPASAGYPQGSRRDSDPQDETVKVEDPNQTTRKVEVYKYYERDAGTAVEEHFKRALDWANSNHREGKLSVKKSFKNSHFYRYE